MPRKAKTSGRLISAMADRQDLSGDEAMALLRVVGEYRFALDLLDDYDYQRVGDPRRPVGPVEMSF